MPAARPGRSADGSLPTLSCSCCGSQWFRECQFELWNACGNAIGVMHHHPPICICGLPWAVLGGVRGGRTPNVEIKRFLDSLRRIPEWVIRLSDDETCFPSKATESAAGLLQKRISTFECRSDRIAHRLRLLRLAKGSNRLPSDKGKDVLVVAVQNAGYSRAKAKRAVDLVFKLWRQRLIGRELVETPIGLLNLKRRPDPQIRQQLGRKQVMFSRSWRIVTSVTLKSFARSSTFADPSSCRSS